jgi:hypothetical protein
VRTKNWIRGRSRIDDNGRLFTSSSKVTNMVEEAKTLAAKEIRLMNSSCGGRETNSVQPLRMRNTVVTHEQSLQLHYGRKVLWMKVICTRSVKHTK